MSDDLKTSDMTWSEAAAAASSFHKVLRAAAKIEKACEKARDAEDYMKGKHAEKKVVEDRVKELQAQVRSLEDELNNKKADTAEALAELEVRLKTRKDECSQRVRDAENAARKAHHDYEQAQKNAERNLAVEKQNLEKALKAEEATIREAIQAETSKLRQERDEVKREILNATNERNRLNAVLEEARAKFANLGV